MAVDGHQPDGGVPAVDRLPCSVTRHWSAAGASDAMDDTLRFVLSFAIPLICFAVVWGGMQVRVTNLQDEGKRRDAEFKVFLEDDRKRSHELNLSLSAALEEMSRAARGMADFDARHGNEIRGTSNRSRRNQERIEHLERNDAQAALTRLKHSGVPIEQIEEISQVLSRPRSEHSSTFATSTATKG